CFSCISFQGEDGIRDFHVTGVQTCAVPIYIGTAFTAQSKIALRGVEANLKALLPTAITPQVARLPIIAIDNHPVDLSLLAQMCPDRKSVVWKKCKATRSREHENKRHNIYIY